MGTLKSDDQLADGLVTTKFGISLLLPTLPDPYVSNYKPVLRESRGSVYSSGNLQLTLSAFIKWADAESSTLYFHFSNYDYPYLPDITSNQAVGNISSIPDGNLPVRKFRTAVTGFGRRIIAQPKFADFHIV